jgi:hypothetical protein
MIELYTIYTDKIKEEDVYHGDKQTTIVLCPLSSNCYNATITSISGMGVETNMTCLLTKEEYNYMIEISMTLELCEMFTKQIEW